MSPVPFFTSSFPFPNDANDLLLRPARPLRLGRGRSRGGRGGDRPRRNETKRDTSEPSPTPTVATDLPSVTGSTFDLISQDSKSGYPSGVYGGFSSLSFLPSFYLSLFISFFFLLFYWVEYEHMVDRWHLRSGLVFVSRDPAVATGVMWRWNFFAFVFYICMLLGKGFSFTSPGFWSE